MSPAADPSASLPTKIGYSLGNLGKSVVWTSFDNFMLFYLVSVAGLPTLLAGALLAVAMLWDALFDLGIALWADAHGGSDRLGRLIVMGAPLCAVGFWLVFSLDTTGAIAAAILVCRIGYSLCDVGHNTLLVRVARTPRDATSVSGFRLIFSACGAGLVALASTWSLSPSGAAARQDAFATGALIGGVLYAATLLTALVATRRLARPSARPQRISPVERMRALWRHPPFRQTLQVIAVQAGMVPLFLRTLPFFGQAVYHDPSWAGPALATITLGQSLALPGWMALARRWPPDRIARIGHGTTIVALCGLLIGSRGVGGTALLLLLGAALSATNIAIWALLALAAQRSGTPGQTGEATSVGLFLAVLKGAAAIGTLVSATIVALTVEPTIGGTHVPLLATSVLAVPIVGCLSALYFLRGQPDRLRTPRSTRPELSAPPPG